MTPHNNTLQQPRQIHEELEPTKTHPAEKMLQFAVYAVSCSAKRKSSNWTFGSPLTRWLHSASALLAFCGLFTSISSCLTNPCQKIRSFSQVKLQLGSSDPEERVAAVLTVSDSANCLAEHRDEAIRLLVLGLETETDSGVIKTSIKTLPQLGTSALSLLIQQNKHQYEQLVRATGRLLGIQSVIKRINVPGQPTADDLMAIYLFKQLPAEIMKTSLPWQSGSISDIEFVQMSDELAIQPDFRTAFEQTIKSTEATGQDEANARREFQASVRDLWINSQAITAMLKSLSGKLDGLSLRKTVLLHPDLTGVDLRGVDARSTIWTAPVLAKADLSFASLSNAEMKYADLRNANLTGADVSGADFGRPNQGIEKRTTTHISFLQKDVTLYGANLWEMKACFLKDQNFIPNNLQKFKDERQETLAKPAAKEYLTKILSVTVDD